MIIYKIKTCILLCAVKMYTERGEVTVYYFYFYLLFIQSMVTVHTKKQKKQVFIVFTAFGLEGKLRNWEV